VSADEVALAAAELFAATCESTAGTMDGASTTTDACTTAGSLELNVPELIDEVSKVDDPTVSAWVEVVVSTVDDVVVAPTSLTE
jgi:hypothetical protein